MVEADANQSLGPRVNTQMARAFKTGWRVLITLLVLAILALLFQSVFIVIPLRWEYRIVDFGAESPKGVDRPRVESGAGDFSYVNPAESALNELGQEGWEMVGCYLEMETAWPNFGDPKYIIGLQPNVRPQRLVLIFKRPR